MKATLRPSRTTTATYSSARPPRTLPCRISTATQSPSSTTARPLNCRRSIRRAWPDGSAPYRGQGLFTESGQRVEQTVKTGFTNVCFVTIRNYGAFADRFVFNAPTNIPGGIDARYFLQPAGTDISAVATNGGWTSDIVSVGDTREVRIQVVASNTNLFNQDLVFTSTSLTDPTKVDVVRLRLLRDDDNDGLPDSWEQQYFGNPTNAVASDDTDRDGFS